MKTTHRGVGRQPCQHITGTVFFYHQLRAESLFAVPLWIPCIRRFLYCILLCIVIYPVGSVSRENLHFDSGSHGAGTRLQDPTFQFWETKFFRSWNIGKICKRAPYPIDYYPVCAASHISHEGFYPVRPVCQEIDMFGFPSHGLLPAPWAVGMVGRDPGYDVMRGNSI